MERNQVLIGIVSAVVVALGTVFAVGLTGGLFVPGMRVEAEFSDAAGLSSGDFVFLAGVRVGQVTDVWIEQDRAVAEFAVEADGVPADSDVAIILQSTLGKRALRIDPGTATETLEEGDRITRTSTPVDLPELGDRSAELLGEVDVQALQLLTTALADITEGQRGNVGDLLEGVQQVSEILVERRGDLERVLDRAQSVVDTAADSDREIIQIVDQFGTVLDTLLNRSDDIERLLVETADTSDLTADLLEERRAQLDQVLAELHRDLEVIDAHQVDLAHLFAYGGVAFEGFAGIGYGFGPEKVDNPSWGNVFVTGAGQVGVDALFNCGATLDRVFTLIIGPDPRCEEEGDPNVADDGDPGAAVEATPTSARDGYADVTSFFDIGDLAPLPPLDTSPATDVVGEADDLLGVGP